MTKYLAGVLTVIAAGVLAVAYGLLAPGRSAGAMTMQAPLPQFQAMDATAMQRQVGLSQPVAQQALPYAPVAYAPQAFPAGYVSQPAQVVTYVPASNPYVQAPIANAPRPVQTVAYEPAPRVRPSNRRIVEREPRRDWKRTAMIVGGSTAAGAGIGGIVGGKKGALIGAAIAGGATTIFQTTKRD